MGHSKGYRYYPPEGTEPTTIHDIFGASIVVHFPIGDKESPRRLENAIRQAQLGGGRPSRKRVNREGVKVNA